MNELQESDYLKDLSDCIQDLQKLLYKKGSNYGNSVCYAPALTPNLSPQNAILVRMSDKIARLKALSGGEADKVGESFRDTMQDLAGYIIIWLTLDNQKEK